MSKDKHDFCEVCGKRKQIQSKTCITCFNRSKMPEDVQNWMRDYDLHRCQLRPDVVEHLRSCTPLGREILLIIMRLERDQSFSKRAKALQGELHRENIEKRRARKAIEREEQEQRDRIRVQAAIQRIQAKPAKKAPVVVVPEVMGRISRMMQLAERIRA